MSNSPTTTSYTKKHKDQGLVVIAIHSAEEADDVDAFIAERGYTLPIAVDEGASAQRYGIWNFPQSVLLGRDCRIAWLSAGRRNAESQPNWGTCSTTPTSFRPINP